MRPAVTIVSTTYFPAGIDGATRRIAAQQALESWDRHLNYQGELRLHVADDGSPDGNAVGVSRFPFMVSRQERRGVGASLNAGFRQAFERSPLALYAVDDWEVVEPFDLTLWADLLMEREDIGCVRLGPPHPGTRGSVEMFSLEAEPPANPERGGWFLRLDPYGFAFGHRPALYHRRMIDAYGWFEEGVNALECERLYAERYARESLFGDMPQVVLALPHPWRHIDSIELADIEPEGG
jgi:hypothetical protein